MIYLFLAEGFEEIEALTPVDMLRRAGKDIRTVGIGGKIITGSHGISVSADITEDEFDDKTPEMIILPGGLPGTNHLEASPVVQRAIDRAVESGAYIAAICAAPTVLARRGLLTGKEATCYPSMKSDLVGAVLSEKTVAHDGKIITAAGMGVSLDFSLELISALCGEEKAKTLRAAVVA